ncbi:MAG: TIGR00304 family membrane protein [Thermoprotei archaeon]
MNVTLFDIGIVVTFVGLIVLIVGLIYEIMRNLKQADSQQKGETKVGGVILIGPFPIVFGNSKDMVKVSLVLLAIMIALLITLVLI